MSRRLGSWETGANACARGLVLGTKTGCLAKEHFPPDLPKTRSILAIIEDVRRAVGSKQESFSASKVLRRWCGSEHLFTMTEPGRTRARFSCNALLLISDSALRAEQRTPKFSEQAPRDVKVEQRVWFLGSAGQRCGFIRGLP